MTILHSKLKILLVKISDSPDLFDVFPKFCKFKLLEGNICKILKPKRKKTINYSRCTLKTTLKICRGSHKNNQSY